jgi:hypothetical protein
LLPLPINLDTINRLYGLNLNALGVEQFFASMAVKVDHVRTAEDVIVSKVGRELYEKFFRNYTRKQWGLDPSELDASLTARVPIRSNRDDRYFNDIYQTMPLHGYTRMFERMLDHPNIEILLNTDYREVLGDQKTPLHTHTPQELVSELCRMRRNPDEFYFKRRVMCSLGCDHKGEKSAYQIGHANCDDAGSWCATHGWLSFESARLPPNQGQIITKRPDVKKSSAKSKTSWLKRTATRKRQHGFLWTLSVTTCRT